MPNRHRPHEPASETPPAGSFPVAARRALTILAVVACGAVAYLAQDFLIPTAAAVVLALILAPIVKLFERAGIPNAIASFIVVIGVGAVIVGSAYVIAPEIAALIDRSPNIAETIERKTAPIKAWLNSVESATDVLSDATSLGETPATVTAAPAETDSGVVGLAPILVAQTIYVLVLALFLISTRRAYRNRIILLPTDRENRLRVARILNETLSQVSSYLFVISLINLGVGIATAFFFYVAGIPNAVVWGFVFGLACFVPYLGPIAAILLCALFQLVATDTLAEAMVAPLILLFINTVEANLVTPLLVSRRLEVSALAVFFTVALFTWLWGPIASIVAVPVLILFGAVARHVPALRPWAILLMCETQQTLDDANDGRRRFFASEEALNAVPKRRILPRLRGRWRDVTEEEAALQGATRGARRPTGRPAPETDASPGADPRPLPAE
jgi:predicted PurR-regulated permease PerM